MTYGGRQGHKGRILVVVGITVLTFLFASLRAFASGAAFAEGAESLLQRVLQRMTQEEVLALEAAALKKTRSSVWRQYAHKQVRAVLTTEELALVEGSILREVDEVLLTPEELRRFIGENPAVIEGTSMRVLQQIVRFSESRGGVQAAGRVSARELLAGTQDDIFAELARLVDNPASIVPDESLPEFLRQGAVKALADEHLGINIADKVTPFEEVLPRFFASNHLFHQRPDDLVALLMEHTRSRVVKGTQTETGEYTFFNLMSELYPDLEVSFTARSNGGADAPVTKLIELRYKVMHKGSAIDVRLELRYLDDKIYQRQKFAGDVQIQNEVINEIVHADAPRIVE